MANHLEETKIELNTGAKENKHHAYKARFCLPTPNPFCQVLNLNQQNRPSRQSISMDACSDGPSMVSLFVKDGLF